MSKFEHVGFEVVGPVEVTSTLVALPPFENPAFPQTVTGKILVDSKIVGWFGNSDGELVIAPEATLLRMTGAVVDNRIVLHFDSLPEGPVAASVEYDFDMEEKESFEEQKKLAFDGNLDLYYAHQFVQNETLTTRWRAGLLVAEGFEHQPVIAGTTTGTLYDGNTALATFVDYRGEVSITPIGATSVLNKAICTGNAIVFTLNAEAGVGNYRTVVSYEYNMDSQPKKAKRVVEKQKNYEACTFESFLSAEDLEWVKKNAGTVTAWDFNTARGDTLKVRLETLLCKLTELRNVLMAKGARGYAWIVVDSSTAGWLECGHSFRPTLSDQVGPGGQRPCGLGTTDMGLFGGWLRVFRDDDFDPGVVLMGFNDVKDDNPSFYGRMIICNLVGMN